MVGTDPPLGDACLSAIEVDPADEQTWYATGINDLYQTHDGGLTWTHPLAGAVNSQGLRLVPGSPWSAPEWATGSS